MKLLAFLFSLLFVASALGAMPNSANIYFDSTATASNLNGGGFNPARAGVNYANQPNAQYNFTNLASSNATTNPCVVSSASHNFVTADEGNFLHITAAGSNFTTGWYEIVSTSGNNATLDKACGTNASASSGTFYVGGALPTVDDATLEALLAAGDNVYFKGGAGPITYTVSGTVSLSVNGTGLLPIRFIGYSGSPGDSPTGTTRPIIDAGANVFTFGNNYISDSLYWTGTATSVLTCGTGTNRTINSKFVNTSATANRIGLNCGGTCTIEACEFVSIRGVGISIPSTSATFISDSYFHDSNTGISIGSTSSGVMIINSISESNVTSAVTLSNPQLVSIYGCTFYGAEAKLGVGITTGATAAGLVVLNSIIAGFTTGVSYGATNSAATDLYNLYYNNTANASNWVLGTGAQTTVNPSFANVTQITGTTATTSAGGVLNDSSKNFSAVQDGIDYVYVSAGTGITVGKYLVVSHTTTSLSLSPAISTNATADKVYSLSLGHNFAPSYVVKGLGFPGTFPGGLSIGYRNQGAVQRREGFPRGWF